MRQIVVIALLLTATAAVAGDHHSECRYEEPRTLKASLAGVTRIVVHGVAGTLHVDGRAGVGEFVASGTACTSDKDLLRDITLTAHRSGSTLHVEADTPDHNGFSFNFWEEARLDFGVVVPNNVPIEVQDGSGSTKVTNTATVKIEDGSGSLTIENIHGDLIVNDGSGSIEIDGVTGNVEVEDGSGDMTIANVSGNVEIEDNSGSIDVSHSKHNVLITDDGSGGIDVTDVGGDFTVRSKGSGGIHYARVAGKVSVPRDDD